MTDKPDTSMNARIIEEFRANAGKAGPWERGNLLLLHTTGAKSGEPRLNPVGCFRIGDKMLIVGSYAGALIIEVCLAMRARLPVSEIALTMHAYPTLPEAVEAAAFQTSVAPLSPCHPREMDSEP
jgi:hypothetical protein